MTRVAEGPLSRPEFEGVKKELLEDALKFYQGLLQQKSTDQRVQYETASASGRVATIQSALGHPAEANQAARQALELFEQLEAVAPANSTYRLAAAQATAALAYSLSYPALGPESEGLYVRAVARWQKLSEEMPAHRAALASTQESLGYWYWGNGRTEEAERAYRAALRVYDELTAQAGTSSPHQYAQAHTLNSLGLLLRLAGRPQEAVDAHHRALDLLNQAPNQTLSRERARTLGHLGLAQWRCGQPAEAERFLRQALALREQIIAVHPRHRSDRETRADLAMTHSSLAMLLESAGRHAEAEKSYTETSKQFAELAAEFVDNWHYANVLAGAHARRGKMLQGRGRVPEARAAYTEARRVFEQTLLRAPCDGETNHEFARFLSICPDPDFRDEQRAVALAKKAVALMTQNASHWTTLGIAHYRAGDWKAAVAALEKSMELRNGGDSNDWFFLGMARSQLGEKEEARKRYDQAVEWMEKNKPDDEELRRFRAEAAELLKINQQPTTQTE